MNLQENFKNDISFGFLDRATSARKEANPRLISNEHENTMLRALREELREAKKFTFSVAFVSSEAIAMLKQPLLNTSASGTIITSDYLGFNSPKAFRELLNLAEHTGVEVRVFSHPKSGFHAKGYVFEQEDTLTAIIGSSNLTPSALLKNKEWNLRFSALPGGDIVEQIERAVNEQRRNSFLLSEQWIAEYETTYVARIPAKAPQGASVLPPEAFAPQEHLEIFESGAVLAPSAAKQRIVPNKMQEEALEAISLLRARGENRALIVSATGTGKTILSALDVRAFGAKRVLFVVHREQILDRAIYEFQRVLEEPIGSFGKFVGSTKSTGAKYVFATIQSLSRPGALAGFSPEAFDYILVDEVHKAGAPSYRTLFNHFRPSFLLGMTATPERTDGENIFEIFDFNVPYEIRLQRALEEEMLAPFHYYGVTDYVDESGSVVDETTDLKRLVSAERVDHLLRAISRYGHVGTPVRGLIFCSRKEEAHNLSSELNERFLNGRKLRTRALTGDDKSDTRERVVTELESGELDYILTVDIFNEGIDIPSVNQVVMLRQTTSSIVFTQQLGRGLRKAAGKDYLVVIDFIGNYKTNFLVPIALFGDRTLNKDSIRQKMIQADDAGHIAGVSSVHFDEISRERIFKSLSKAKLNNVAALKSQIRDLEFRLNRIPKLIDFARSDSADPVVIGTAEGNYWSLLSKSGFDVPTPSAAESAHLSHLALELLNGKRPHELVLLKDLLQENHLERQQVLRSFADQQLPLDGLTEMSVRRVLNLEFFTEAERKKYGSQPIVEYRNDRYELNPMFLAMYRQAPVFRDHVDDVVETGLYLARHRYQWDGNLQVGKRYSRKDACRLLNWSSNQQSTVYGYKLDTETATLPIFITYHKDDEITSSVLYDEGFIGPSTIRWASKPKRTLKSKEIQQILTSTYDLHVFVKKNDADGLDFFYLGTGRIHSPKETTQVNKEGKHTPIVEMIVDLQSPVETALYDYLLASVPV